MSKRINNFDNTPPNESKAYMAIAVFIWLMIFFFAFVGCKKIVVSETPSIDISTTYSLDTQYLTKIELLILAEQVKRSNPYVADSLKKEAYKIPDSTSSQASFPYIRLKEKETIAKTTDKVNDFREHLLDLQDKELNKKEDNLKSQEKAYNGRLNDLIKREKTTRFQFYALWSVIGVLGLIIMFQNIKIPFLSGLLSKIKLK